MTRYSRTNLLTLGLLALVTTVSACGDSDGGGSGGGKDPLPKSPDLDATYYLDGDAITGSGADLTHDTKPVLWTYSLTVDGELRASDVNVTSEDLRDELANQPVKGSSQLHFELTVRDHKGAKPSLATNLKKDADEAPKTAAIWENSCTDVSPEISLYDEATVIEVNGKKRLKIDFRLCDFAKVLVAPTISVKPAQLKDDPRLVVYECAMGNNPGYFNLGYLLYAYDPYKAACHVGYSKPRSGAIVTGSPIKNGDGSMKTIEVPKGMSNEPFEMDTGNMFLDYLPNAGAAKRFKVSEERLMGNSDEPLPLARMRDCTGLEIQTMYKDDASAANGTIKESRLTFQRTFDEPSATMVWVADNQTAIPAASAINAAAQDEIRFWLHCTWNNKLGADIVTVAPDAN